MTKQELENIFQGIADFAVIKLKIHGELVDIDADIAHVVDEDGLRVVGVIEEAK